MPTRHAEGPHEFLDPDVLARLSGLPLHARIPMLGSVSGRHRSPIRGSSLEFAEYRKYVPGDDTRRLDWRAWGRSDRFYIKEFEADTNLRLCLVLDTSGSMSYGRARGQSKFEFAVKMAATLAHIAARQGDAVGLCCAAEGIVREIQPRRNARHLRHVLDVLGEVRPTGESRLAEALHAVAEKVSQCALVVIFSDFFVDPAELEDCFQHLRFRKHDVAAFHMLEKDELDLDFDRPIRFVDLEGGPSVLAEPSVVRDRYRDAVQEYVEALDKAVKDAAVDFHQVSTDQPYEDVLGEFLVRRLPKRGRR